MFCFVVVGVVVVFVRGVREMVEVGEVVVGVDVGAVVLVVVADIEGIKYGT